MLCMAWQRTSVFRFDNFYQILATFYFKFGFGYLSFLAPCLTIKNVTQSFVTCVNYIIMTYLVRALLIILKYDYIVLSSMAGVYATMCPERDSILGPRRMAVFEDGQVTRLTNRPPRPGNFKLYLFTSKYDLCLMYVLTI